MKHVNPSFNIQAPGIEFEAAQLFIEMGPSGVSLVVLDSNNCFIAVVTYTFTTGIDESEIIEKLKAIFSSENLLQNRYSKTHLFWSFPESILVPVELMNADRNTNMLNLIFGDANQGNIRSDFLYKNNLHNVYRTPQFAIDFFSSYFPVATQTHLFSTIVNKDLPEGNHLFTVFYSHSITIMLCKEGKLQVVQNFIYNNPDDCVFHLLNICKGFEIDPISVSLHISGLIDENSVLFTAIYKYFVQIEFEKLPADFDYNENIKTQPPHFFSHLFTLASCV